MTDAQPPVQYPATPPRPPSARSPGQLVGVTLMLGSGLVLLWWLWNHPTRLVWADSIAVAIALICLGAAVRLLIDSFDRGELGRRMQVEGEGTPREAAQARLQAGMLLVLGLTIVLPVAAQILGQQAPLAVYAVIVLLVALRIVYLVHVMRTGDEFLKRRVQEAQSVIFMIMTTVMLLYAGAERLGLAPQASAWDILVLVTLSTFIVPGLLTSRRKPAA